MFFEKTKVAYFRSFHFVFRLFPPKIHNLKNEYFFFFSAPAAEDDNEKKNFTLSVPVLAAALYVYSLLGRGAMPHHMEKDLKVKALTDLHQVFTKTQAVASGPMMMSPQYSNNFVKIIPVACKQLPSEDDFPFLDQIKFLKDIFPLKAKQIAEGLNRDILDIFNSLYRIKKTINTDPGEDISKMNHIELMEHTASQKLADRNAKIDSTARVFGKGQEKLKRHGFSDDEDLDEEYESEDDQEELRHGDELGGSTPGDLAAAHAQLQLKFKNRNKKKKHKKQRKGPNDLLIPQTPVSFLGGGNQKAIGVQDLGKGLTSLQTILEKLADGGLANFDQAVATPLVPHKDTSIKKKLSENDELLELGLINEDEHKKLRVDLLASFSKMNES